MTCMIKLQKLLTAITLVNEISFAIPLYSLSARHVRQCKRYNLLHAQKSGGQCYRSTP